MSNKSVERHISELSAMLHGNFLRKTDEYFEYLNELYSGGENAILQLDRLIGLSHNKIAFLALATRCLLSKRGCEEQVALYEGRFGPRYLVALELNLGIFLKGLNSPRGGAALNRVQNIKRALAENLKHSHEIVSRRNSGNGLLHGFVDDFFSIIRNRELSEPMTLGVVVDDLNPLKTATLTKMVFDQIAVLLEYTNHRFVIICSRLHAPQNEFWMPGVHQTRMVTLEEYAAHYDISLPKYKERLSMLNLNEYFYGEKARAKLAVNAFITYPFRHGRLEPALYAKAPVVEIEIMSGISKAVDCDVIIPNGVPSEALLKAKYSKIQIVTPPRRKFKGGKNEGFVYLKGEKKFVVSASKDFDKRAELDISTFLEHVADFLNQNQDCSWVFVGGSPDFEASMAARFASLVTSNRLITVSYEQNLPGLLELAYLYVQPPIIGGGRAPAIAIENACPALTFEFGDCTKYIPYACQRKDYPSMFKSIEEIVRDEGRRKDLLDICLNVIAPAVNIEAAVIYEAAIKRACVKYQGRLATRVGL